MTQSFECFQKLDLALLTSTFTAFLKEEQHEIGQRLFIVNIYLENLNKFGNKNIQVKS